MDLGDTVTHVCPCGSRLWTINAMFENFDIALWFTEARCAICGTTARVPTPADHPDYPLNVS